MLVPDLTRHRGGGQPACELSPDSDLGDKLVTTGVGRLTPSEIGTALDCGSRAAERLLRAGLIEAAALFLAGEARVCGALPAASAREAISAKERIHA